MTVNQLTAAGYGFYKGDQFKGEFCVGLWQKRVRNETGKTLYFINVYQWDFQNMPKTARARYSFQVEIDLYSETMDFRIQPHPEPDTTPEQVEAWVASVHKTMSCGVDRHND